jgi:signal transduction histidine kinase
MRRRPGRRNVGQVSVEPAITRTLASLRHSGAQHDVVQRRLLLRFPALLAVFVLLAAYHAHPGPGVTGRGLVVSVAVGGYIVGVVSSVILLGGLSTSNTIGRLGGTRLAVTVAALVLASSVALLCAQPRGPGAFGAFVGVLLLARLWPRRIALLVPLWAFVVLEAIVGLSGQGLGGLTVLAALAGSYGLAVLAVLAVRLREANDQAGALLVELEQSRAAEARAAGLAERQRLAREMHDVLAHSLSGLLLQLEGARMLAADSPADPRIPGAIDRAHHLGRTGLAEARRAIGMLRDDDLPGPDCLEELAAQFQDDCAIPCQLDVSGDARPLGSEARLAVYRVAQEALTNITRHTHADHVDVRLRYEPSATRLTIEDFAREASTGEQTRSGDRDGDGDGDGGYGLTGMRERAELLGGTLTAQKACSGFRVELELPA